MTGNALNVDSGFFFSLFFWSRERLQRAGLTHSQGEVALFSVAALIWSDICDGGETHPGEYLAPQVAFDKRGTASRSTFFFLFFFFA